MTPEQKKDDEELFGCESKYSALQAQEVASQFTKEGPNYPVPDDPRYTPYIGLWDGYKAPEVRFMDFHLKRKQLRRTALAKALGEDKEENTSQSPENGN